jgi:tRNA nucleotidyltransferase (CCA-adding enzyme)
MALALVARDARPPLVRPRWEHFTHGTEIGVRGIGPTRECAFEQAAIALAAIAVDPAAVRPRRVVVIGCAEPEDRMLLVSWLGAVAFEMAVRRMVFVRFALRIDGCAIAARAWGEEVDSLRHGPAGRPRGAVFDAACVGQGTDGSWRAQCVVDA